MKASSRGATAAARAVWLAELAEAIDQAQRVAWRLGVLDGRADALELYVRLEVARDEVNSLRGRITVPNSAGDQYPFGIFPAPDKADASEASSS